MHTCKMPFTTNRVRSAPPKAVHVQCAKGFGKTSPKKSSAPKPKTVLQRDNCPCGSGRKYEECCEVYHRGEVPSTIQATLRSRFSAYVKGRPDYLVNTTHPDYHKFTYGTEPGGAKAKLVDDVFVGCKINNYFDLQVVGEEQVSDDEGYITFSYSSVPKKTASSDQPPKWMEKFGAGGHNQDAAALEGPHSTTERSKFLKDGDYWKFAEYTIVASTDPEMPVTKPASSS